VVLGEGVDLFHVPVPASLNGRSLAETAIFTKTGLNVIAIQDEADAVSLPTAETRVRAGLTPIAVGAADDRERFREVFR
jgi:K+/H+ antiporter YhaU regulatory subunit KhtT